MQEETTRARASEIRVGEVFSGHSVDAVLGRGGMGVVYRVTDLRLNRLAALKVIAPGLSADDDFRRRFQRESQLAASVRHPHVVPIFQAGEADGLLYVTMELIEGADLRTLIAERRRLDPGTACEALVQVAGALDAAHARGLVHRDVKPANILVRSDAPLHSYLTDFGLTKRTSSQSGITKTGLFVGTVDYASPEQIKGGSVDARSDVYALGCVLFEMLAGQPPFRRENEYATIYAHTDTPPPALDGFVTGVPGALETVVRRALEKDPADRFPSAGDFGRAASAAIAGRMLSEPERTVAVGRAAPHTGPDTPPQASVAPATPAPQPPPAPAPPPQYVPEHPPQRAPEHQTAVLAGQRRGGWVPALVAMAALLLVIGGATAAILLTRSSGGGRQGGVASQPLPAQQPAAGAATTPAPSATTQGVPQPAAAPTQAAPAGGYIAQFGYFGRRFNAFRAARLARSHGLSAKILSSSRYAGPPPGGWVVYDGFFNTRAEAQAVVDRSGVAGAFVRKVTRR
jgi:hypothetical protein